MPYNPARYQDKWRLERLAKRVRELLGVTQLHILSPWQIAEAIPAHVFYVEDLLPRDVVSVANAARWDGFAFTFPGEEHLIVVLNSTRPRSRQSATLMEELSHHILRHKSTRIVVDPDSGLSRRGYDKAQEQEAYEFGSMVLLPKELIQHHVKVLRQPARSLAERCECSIELVEFRIKRCRLWDRYLATCG